MATTTPYGIYYPIASDSVAPLHTAFSTLADSVNTAMTDSIGAVVAKQQNAAYTVATVADMNAIASPPIGATCFVTATSSLYVWDGTVPWNPLYVPWTSYSPTAITGFTISAKYTISNNMVTVNATLTKNTTAAVATSILLSLPLQSDSVMSSRMPIGGGTLFDDSAVTTYNLSVFPNNINTARVLYQSGNPVKLTLLDPRPSSSTPVVLANTDVISLNFTYPLP